MTTGSSRLLRALLGWAVFLGISLLGGVVAPLAFLLGRVRPRARERIAAFAFALAGAYVRWIPFMRLEVVNPEKRLEGARVLVANHQSRLDSMIVIALEPGVFGPVRGYMLKVPLVGWAIRLLGFFDIDVGPKASIAAADRAAARAVREGLPLLFYPEGTRSRTGELGAFRRGACRVAFDHGLPIQPVVIEGVEHVLPPGAWCPPVPARYPVKVCYLDPVLPVSADGARPDEREAMARIRDAMSEQLEKLRAQRRGDRVHSR